MYATLNGLFILQLHDHRPEGELSRDAAESVQIKRRDDFQGRGRTVSSHVFWDKIYPGSIFSVIIVNVLRLEGKSWKVNDIRYSFLVNHLTLNKNVRVSSGYL